METSQNGWPASRTLPTRLLTVNGVDFRIADNDDVEVVFRYIVEQYAATVEPLKPGQCFGYNYRPNVNNPSELSNHSSATALDINSEQHPNAKPTLSTMTRVQVAACHAILASVPELAELVHWGGDWATPLTTDAMHWELHDHDLAKLRRVADRIRDLEDPMADYAAQLDRIEQALAGSKRREVALRKAVKALATEVEDSVSQAAAAVQNRVTKSKNEVLAALAEADDGVADEDDPA